MRFSLLWIGLILVSASPCYALEKQDSDDLLLKKVTIGADLFPTAGTSSLARGQDLRYVSLNFVGWSGAVKGIELAYLANINRHWVTGFQASSIANVNLGARFTGVQFSGIFGYTGGTLSGVQLSGIGNVSMGELVGVQASGIGSIALGAVRGVQASGIGNVALGPFHGLQVAAIGNFVKGKVDGVQIGLVNVAEDSDFSLGLINVMYKGRTHIDLWGNSSGFGFAGLKHGGKYWHSIYSAGMRPTSEDGGYAMGLGIGLHLPLADRVFLDIDGLVYGVNDEDTTWEDINTLATIRAVAGFRITEDIAIFAGLEGNVLATNRGDAERFAPFASSPIHQRECSAKASVAAWPGVLLGVQFLGKPFKN